MVDLTVSVETQETLGNAIPFYRSNRPVGSTAFFSICVPQYNRTDFFMKAIESFRSQSFADFEVCISDGGSTDQKHSVLLDYLNRSGLIFVYARAGRRLEYDSNLRSALALSIGQYILLMGNDDELSDPGILQSLHDDLERFKPISVAVANFRECESERVNRRILQTELLGQGPKVAAKTFRTYSFLSGVILEGDAARAAATDKCDGTEMYQMYLGTRLVAEGGRYLGIDRLCINKGIQVQGQTVDSYRSRPRLKRCPIEERRLPLGRLLEVVATGMETCPDGLDKQRNLKSVAKQLYRFTFPFWILEYRRVQSLRYAIGVFLGLRPTVVTKSVALERISLFRIWILYAVTGFFALTIPIKLFDILRPSLYAFAKRL